MRYVKHLLLSAAFVAFLVPTVFPVWAADAPIPIVLHAGTASDPAICYNSATVAMVFDDTYTPLGQTLVRIDCEILSASGTPVTTWTLVTGAWIMEAAVAPSMLASIRVPIRTQATTLPNGTYQLRVRVYDPSGNMSGWSQNMYVTKAWITLEAPGGCRTIQ